MSQNLPVRVYGPRTREEIENEWNYHKMNIFNQRNEITRRESYIYLVEEMARGKRFSERLPQDITRVIVSETTNNLFFLLSFIEVYVKCHYGFLSNGFRLYPIFKGLMKKFERDYYSFSKSRYLKNTMRSIMPLFKHTYFVILILRLIAETTSMDLIKWALLFTEWLQIDEEVVHVITPITPVKLVATALEKILVARRYRYQPMGPNTKHQLLKCSEQFLAFLFRKTPEIQLNVVTDHLGRRHKEELFSIIRNVGEAQ